MTLSEAARWSRVMPPMPKSPDYDRPKPSWREVVLVTLVIAAVVAGYFWLAR